MTKFETNVINSIVVHRNHMTFHGSELLDKATNLLTSIGFYGHNYNIIDITDEYKKLGANFDCCIYRVQVK